MFDTIHDQIIGEVPGFEATYGFAVPMKARIMRLNSAYFESHGHPENRTLLAVPPRKLHC